MNYKKEENLSKYLLCQYDMPMLDNLSITWKSKQNHIKLYLSSLNGTTSMIYKDTKRKFAPLLIIGLSSGFVCNLKCCTIISNIFVGFLSWLIEIQSHRFCKR